MSKAALNMQSSVVHNNLKEHGGQVLVIHPGWMRTYMRGEIDKDAVMSPKESAAAIVRILPEYCGYKSEKPLFVDFLGKEMPW